jgi:hypothetical protein
MGNLDTVPRDVQFCLLDKLVTLGLERHQLSQHPFFLLSSVSRTQKAVVESYCRHALRAAHASFPNRKDIPREPYISARKSTYRRVYLEWTSRICRFCKVRCQRRAEADDTVVCCSRCDKIVWPYKMKAHLATKVFGVEEQVILGTLPAGSSGTTGWCVSVPLVWELTKKLLEVRAEDMNHFLHARVMVQDLAAGWFREEWIKRRDDFVKQQEELVVQYRWCGKPDAELDELLRYSACHWQHWYQSNQPPAPHAMVYHPWFSDISSENREAFRYMREEGAEMKRCMGIPGVYNTPWSCRCMNEVIYAEMCADSNAVSPLICRDHMCLDGTCRGLGQCTGFL